MTPQRQDSQERREEILQAYQERPSMRGIRRIFGVSRKTLAAWIPKKLQTLPALRQTLPPARPDDVLDVDEAWSVVRKRVHNRWLWTVLLRRTTHILAFVLGDLRVRTGRRLCGIVFLRRFASA